jgi:hypothetical protein
VHITKASGTQLCVGRDTVTVSDRDVCRLTSRYFERFHDRQPPADVRNPTNGIGN